MPDVKEVWECVREITQPTRGNARFSVRQFAHDARVAPVTVYKWGESNGNAMPAEMVAPLTRFYGDDLLIENLALDCGGTFVRHPEAAISTADVARLTREFSEVLQALAERDEGAARMLIVKEGRDLIAAMLSVMAQAGVVS